MACKKPAEFNLRCFGERRVRRRYLDRVIVDYEGGGVSAAGWDPAFKRARAGLILRHLGPKHFLLRALDVIEYRVSRGLSGPHARPCGVSKTDK